MAHPPACMAGLPQEPSLLARRCEASRRASGPSDQISTSLRVTRSSMLKTLRQYYVVTARSKGLAERDVVFGHARPNALLPVITMAGFSIVGLLGGVVITESVFSYPGIGSAAARAAVSLDIVTMLGFAIFNGLILIVANLIVDIVYAFIDPRVRLS
mgnify:CR=1 FL=1